MSPNPHGSSGGDVGRELLTGAALALVDAATDRLFASLDVRATLDAIVAVFVPAFAETALIALDERDDPRCRRGAQSTVPLVVDGQRLGSVYLTGTIDADTLPVLRRLADRAARALSHALRFEHERRVALRFQTAALTTHLPSTAHYRFSALYAAGRNDALVGGDWYDAIELEDGRVVVSVGDVQGSGLDAAVTMANVRQTIRGVAQIHPDPAFIVDAAHRAVRTQAPERFVTAFVGLLDPVTQRMTYANAGHPAPMVRLPDGPVRALGRHGLPLGIDGFEGVVDEARLAPGSRLVLYTDGLIESERDAEKGERQLEAAIRQDPLDAADAAQYLHDTVVRGGVSHDDVAILVVSVCDAVAVQRWRFDPIWADVVSRVRKELWRALAELRLRRSLLDVELAVTELFSNAIRYAPGTVELILEVRDDGVTIHLVDKGPGFQYAPRLPADLYSENGRGLFLISVLADRFTVERRAGGGSHARLLFARKGDPHDDDDR